jgi:hypothetical protein
MTAKTIYDTTTGRILATSVSGRGGPPPGETVRAIDGIYDATTQYILDGVPTDKAVINYTLDKEVIAPGGEVATVTGLPIGSTVMHRLTTYQTDAGSFTFDSETVGAYIFTVNHPAYLVARIKITAEEP